MLDLTGNAIVFDLDGTLIDSAPDIQAAVNRMLADLDRPPLSLAEVTSFIGNGLPHLVRLVMEVRDLQQSVEDKAQSLVLKHLSDHPADLTQPYPGVVDALTQLKRQGAKLGICTNKYRAPSIQALDALGLSNFFDTVVGGDTLPVRKPDARPLQKAFEDLGGRPLLYVGDSEVDAATAKNAGISFGLFLCGYRKTPPEELTTLFQFEDFSDLPGQVVRLSAAADGD